VTAPRPCSPTELQRAVCACHRNGRSPIPWTHVASEFSPTAACPGVRPLQAPDLGFVIPHNSPETGRRSQHRSNHRQLSADNLLTAGVERGSGEAFVLVGATGFEPVASAV